MGKVLNIKKIRRSCLKNLLTHHSVCALLLALVTVIVFGIVLLTTRPAFIKTENGVISTLWSGKSPADALDSAGISSRGSEYRMVAHDEYDEITVSPALSDAAGSKTDNVDVPQIDTAPEKKEDPTEPLVSIVEDLKQAPEKAEKYVPAPAEELSDDAFVESVKLSDGALSPRFSRFIYSYKASVDYETKKITVKVKASDEKAGVSVEGGKKLKVGKNEITVTAVSESGRVQKKYSIIVTRKKEQKKEESASSSKSSKGHSGNSAGSPVSELKAPHIELDENNQPIHYKELITGKATAYCDLSGKHLATGKNFKPGYVAVNPKQIPYGTKMFIVSPKGDIVYGYAIAADTGGFARNGSGTVVDLAFWSESACNKFGRRTMNIYILE